MTLKDLILKYEFDTVVPDLLTVDEPVKDNLYAFKEAFDTLRRMVPGEDRQATSVTLSTDQRDFFTKMRTRITSGISRRSTPAQPQY